VIALCKHNVLPPRRKASSSLARSLWCVSRFRAGYLSRSPVPASLPSPSWSCSLQLFWCLDILAFFRSYRCRGCQQSPISAEGHSLQSPGWWWLLSWRQSAGWFVLIASQSGCCYALGSTFSHTIFLPSCGMEVHVASFRVPKFSISSLMLPWLLLYTFRNQSRLPLLSIYLCCGSPLSLTTISNHPHLIFSKLLLFQSQQPLAI